MHVSFLMLCFSAVCFFINVSFRAVVGPKSSLSLSVQSTQLCFLLFYCIVSVLMNKIFIHSYSRARYIPVVNNPGRPQLRLYRPTTRHDRCYFNVRSKANIDQPNLPHGTNN